jgi:hypothetical protein
VVRGVRGGVSVRGGLPTVADADGEVIEVHGVVEELLSAMMGSESVIPDFYAKTEYSSYA